MRYLVILFLTLGLGGAFGQEPTPRAERLEQRLEQIRDRVRPTPEQVEKLKPILREEAVQLKALRERAGQGGSRREKLKLAREARGIRDRADAQLKQVLTKTQWSELERLRSEWRDEARAARR